MDLVQAQANLNLQKQNVDFLQQQLNAANDRLKVGEGTKTDVAQTQSKLAAGQSSVRRRGCHSERRHRHLRTGRWASSQEPGHGEAGR